MPPGRVALTVTAGFARGETTPHRRTALSMQYLIRGDPAATCSGSVAGDGSIAFDVLQVMGRQAGPRERTQRYRGPGAPGRLLTNGMRSPDPESRGRRDLGHTWATLGHNTGETTRIGAP